MKNLSVLKEEEMPYLVHDTTHPSYPVSRHPCLPVFLTLTGVCPQVRLQWYNSLIGKFPNLHALDTGFTGSGRTITCPPYLGFLEKFLSGQPHASPLQTYRGVLTPNDPSFVHAQRHLRGLHELSIDIVTRGHNAPRAAVAVIRLPVLELLTVAGYYPASPLAWASHWDLPRLRYLAVYSNEGDEYYLENALVNFGSKLTHLYLRGAFTPNSLVGLESLCPNLVCLEMDWTDVFLSFSCPKTLRTVIFHNTAWLFHYLQPSFERQLRKIHENPKEWQGLRMIKDMTVTSTGEGGRLIRWWTKEDFQAMQRRGISVVDREGKPLRVGDIKGDSGADYPVT